MTTLEQAARQALDALEHLDWDGSERECDEAIAALKAALEQAEPVSILPAPTACATCGEEPYFTAQQMREYAAALEQAVREVVESWQELERERAIEAALKEKNAKQAEPVVDKEVDKEQAEPVAWVGLTDKDRLDIYGQASTDEVDFYARAIEAALKERNAKPVQTEPVDVCFCGDPTILNIFWHRKDGPCFAPQQAEPVAESHKRATGGDNDQSMSGNPSF